MALIVWSVTWKIIALGHALRNVQTAWFINVRTTYTGYAGFVNLARDLGGVLGLW
ncbi:DUF5652 family protein [Candidatus Desulforudis audaxviator]|uniref:DUF5652 family protein n=1 Tax=Candidatus Desulforudis audaxviator TaxID=471827 RepID=UPI0002F582C8|nr:DUF5652 family protein [Candidatus Desulforudis audaxviator]AZK58710.1 hypothetical protein Daudx_0150 [Candidatus Desulforudis audaxviator]